MFVTAVNVDITLHCVSKKVPIFKLSVTLSNLKRFSKIFHCWKVHEICYKIQQHYPSHLRHVATLPRDIKTSNFLRIFSRYVRKCKQLHFCILSAQILIPLCVWLCTLSVFMCFYIKILSLSLNTMLIVDKHCCDVCCGEFSVPQVDRKSKQVKEQDMENFICNQCREKLAISNPENIKIWGRITKLEVIKMQFVSIFPFSSISAEYLQKIWIFTFPGYCSNTTKVRWVISYGFCSKFHTLSSGARILKIA